MKTLKSLIATGILGAGLSLGMSNQVKGQECECVQDNRDNDKFSEEIICWKTDKEYYIKEYTIIHYSDKDGDNFHESIRLLNCNLNMVDLRTIGGVRVFFNIEDFYIHKETGLIDYNSKVCVTSKRKYLKDYPNKSLTSIIKINNHENFKCYQESSSGQHLTPEIIYSLYPNSWSFYGGFGERVKKIINASKDETELKNLVINERYLWDDSYK